MRHMIQYQLIHSRRIVTVVTNRQRRQSQRSWNNIRWLQPIVFYLVLYSSQHTQTLTLRFNERFQRICIYSSIILYKPYSSHSMNTCRKKLTNPSEYPISEDSECLLSITIHTSTHYLHYTKIVEITLPSCHRRQRFQIQQSTHFHLITLHYQCVVEVVREFILCHSIIQIITHTRITSH